MQGHPGPSKSYTKKYLYQFWQRGENKYDILYYLIKLREGKKQEIINLFYIVRKEKIELG